MSALILSFLTSLVVTLLVVRSAASHERLSADFNITGPQKFHSRPVPRIGGIGMLAAVLASGCFLQWNSLESAPALWLLVACGMPAFVAGLAEVSPGWISSSNLAMSCTRVADVSAAARK